MGVVGDSILGRERMCVGSVGGFGSKGPGWMLGQGVAGNRGCQQSLNELLPLRRGQNGPPPGFIGLRGYPEWCRLEEDH
jgi:hypothetical protein